MVSKTDLELRNVIQDVTMEVINGFKSCELITSPPIPDKIYQCLDFNRILFLFLFLKLFVLEFNLHNMSNTNTSPEWIKWYFFPKTLLYLWAHGSRPVWAWNMTAHTSCCWQVHRDTILNSVWVHRGLNNKPCDLIHLKHKK